MAPLVDEMLQRIAAEVGRYERVIIYWRVFGPQLEGAVCAAMRETTASVTRQCGLAQVGLLCQICCLPILYCTCLSEVSHIFSRPSTCMGKPPQEFPVLFMKSLTGTFARYGGGLLSKFASDEWLLGCAGPP